MPVAVGQTTFIAVCGAQSSGSGLRGTKLTVLNGTTELGSAVDSGAESAITDEIPVPAGATSFTIKVERGTQDANVASTFYRCGFNFYVPQTP